MLGWRELPPIGRREPCSKGSPNGCERWFRKSKRRLPRERNRVIAGNSCSVRTRHPEEHVRRPKDQQFCEWLRPVRVAACPLGMSRGAKGHQAL